MKQINWIATAGKAEIKNNSIKYLPEKFKNQLGNEEILSAIVKSNKSFDNGEITFNLNSKSRNARCQLLLNADEGPMLIVGLNVNHGLFGIGKHNKTTNNFDTLALTGLSETFQVGKDYSFRVKVNGSIVELFVNEVLVASAYQQISKSQVAFFFSSEQEITIKDISIDSIQPTAFIVMQFTDDYNDLYKEVIKPVVQEYGYTCQRADEAHTTNPILHDVIQSLKESSVIIADITPNNPNVFYEVGYAHAINKPTILLCDRKRERLPFDISGFRTLFYDNTIAGKSAVETNLKKFLDTLSIS